MRLRTFVFALVFSATAAATTHAAYRVAVWVPPWTDAALTSVQQQGGAISESNPVWYSWNSDGTIKTNWNAENPSWRAAMTGSVLVPTVQNVINGSFDRTVVVSVLATPQSREAHASTIAKLVADQAFDGIDIDYERVPASSRAHFTAFIQLLASKLHAMGKVLSVCVYAKTSDSQNWDGPGAQDWAALGAAADSIKIMTYDYSWSTGPAGPIAPISWVDQVATYAESVIPPHKVMIGMPWYGYDWMGTSGRTVSYGSAMQTAAANNATIVRDASGEPNFTYNGRTVYFQDALSYQKKLEMLKAKHPAIGGVAHWAAGQEDPATWNVVRTIAPEPIGGPQPSAPANPVTPPPAEFIIAGPVELTVTQGSEIAGEYALIPINGFNAMAAVAVQSLSPGLIASINAEPGVSLGDPAQMHVVVDKATPTGVYQLAVRFTHVSITREQVVNVVVTAAPTRARSVRR